MPAWPTLRKAERQEIAALFELEWETPDALVVGVWQTVNTLLRERDGYLAVETFGQTQIISGPFWREADARKAAGLWAGAMGKECIARVGKLSAPAALDLKREEWE
jgi:hypothetical protein